MSTRRRITQARNRVAVLRVLVRIAPTCDEAIRALDEADGHLANALDAIDTADDCARVAEEMLAEALSWIEKGKEIAGVK
jgi:hypothetical protein